MLVNYSKSLKALGFERYLNCIAFDKIPLAYLKLFSVKKNPDSKKMSQCHFFPIHYIPFKLMIHAIKILLHHHHIINQLDGGFPSDLKSFATLSQLMDTT